MATSAEMHAERAKYPRYVYRFLDTREYAEAFAAGSVLISTLKRCRNYENAERGDGDEGKVSYRDSLDLDGSEAMCRKAALYGISVAPGTRGKIENVSTETIVYDAHVLCLTARCDKGLEADFGPHCVRIEDPVGFSGALARAYFSELGAVPRVSLGYALYGGRDYSGVEQRFDPTFLKEPRHAHQQELRIVFCPHSLLNLQPVLLNAPEVAKFCKVVR